MAAQIVPQNTGSKRHFCGSCSYGCASTTKQGPVNNWFPDAAAHGAEFIEGCLVDEITFSNDQTATGVKAIWTSRDRQTTRNLTITAKRVVVAAGTLCSPLVLLRSGLTNPHIGANLYLHPTSTTWAVWKQRTDPWDGSILTSAVTSLEDQDGQHHGVKLEVICANPGIGLLTYPWRATESLNAYANGDKDGKLHSALRFKIDAAKHGHGTGFFAIVRDQDTGKVYIDPKDPTRQRLRVAYTTSASDRAKILEGTLAIARIMFIQGALEIDTGHTGTRRFVRPSARDASKTQQDDEAAFESWLAEIKAAGITSPDPVSLGSAHQMGTCRMSSSPKTGVVDSLGRVWGTNALYVADASCFPTASGVNPMVTTMGIAEWVSRGIVRELGKV
jgi:choline dehydrogenase-like flavoprotein